MIASPPEDPLEISVEAPARLHFGFFDLQREVGRRFGSFGLTVSGIATRLVARRASGTRAHGVEQERVLEFARALQCVHPGLEGVEVEVQQAIPAHAGLGSGTQLALAVGTALMRLAGHHLPPAEIARRLARGARSGVGIGAFGHGGFLIDGGHGRANGVPMITARVDFPASWRVLLVLDRGAPGVHGPAERAAFAALAELPAALSAHLCRLILTRVLPGLVEQDLDEFGSALTEVQQRMGEHFAPAQGGRFASARVADVLTWLQAHGVTCVGQSSWGPTGFAIVESEARARQLLAAREAIALAPELELRVVSGRNRGADVRASARHASATLVTAK